jgi:hypothetical protein
MRARMLRRGMLDPARLEETLGVLVPQLARQPGGLRAYGEIVELFAEEGNFEQACQLEDYWNHLLDKHDVTLLCGYSAAHFADPRHAPSLQHICGKHTGVRSQSSDTLGSWLLSSR